VPIPPPNLTCVHVLDWPTPGGGLCPSCAAAFDADPDAYLEFGDHPAGLENWRREQQLWAGEEAAGRLDHLRRSPEDPGPSSDEIPF